MVDKDNILTKDDLYEIEKVLDVHTGFVTDKLNRTCEIALKIDGTDLSKKYGDFIKGNIKSLVYSRDIFKEIRDKLKKMRLSD